MLTGKIKKKQKNKLQQQEADFGGTCELSFKVSKGHPGVSSQLAAGHRGLQLGRETCIGRTMFTEEHSERREGLGKEPWGACGWSRGGGKIRGRARWGCSVPEGRGGENREKGSRGCPLPVRECGYSALRSSPRSS